MIFAFAMPSRSWRAALLLALGWCLWPTSATAQHVCSGRPDEVMIGVGRGGPGVAGPPLCRWASQSGQAPAQASMPDYFIAVAGHRDSSEIWAAWGHRSKRSAEGAALKGCERAMGEGCLVAASWSNLAEIAVARDVSGTLFVEGASKESGKARKLALAACRKVSTGCQDAGAVTNNPNRGEYFPPAPATRRNYALIAWPKKDLGPEWGSKVWLVSGMQGYQPAERAAIRRCQAESGVECEVGVWNAGGTLVRILDDQWQNNWLSVSDASIARERAQITCAKGRDCAAVELYDARTPRTLTIDLTKNADNPIRGFFSVAWPAAESSPWTKLAVVTGRRSREEADAAAVALCEKDSGEACESYLDHGDPGLAQFAIMLRDSDGHTRVHYGVTSAHAQRRKRESCEKSGVTCDRGRTVDLAVPAELTVDLAS